MQFLMGLNDVYDLIRDQILLIKPMPFVSKAYSMVLRVEKEVLSATALEQSAHYVNSGGNYNYKNTGGFGNLRNSSSNQKGDLFCDFCKKDNHTRETCFKLHGEPNQFKAKKKELRNKKTSGSNHQVHSVIGDLAASPFDDVDFHDNKENISASWQNSKFDVARLVKQEVAHYMQSGFQSGSS